jgi:hypothetical protein
MSTWQFELNFFTLGDIKSRVKAKLSEDSDIDDYIEDWANTVVQWITVEFPQPSLLSDGEDEIRGDGINRIFDLPADFYQMVSLKQPIRSQLGLEEVSPKQLAEQFEVFTPIPVRFPDYYCLVGRKGIVTKAESFSAVPAMRIKFDSIPNGPVVGPPAQDPDIFRYFYYKLHHKLTDDNHPIFLPPEYHSLVVDGVLLEAAEHTGINEVDYDRKERKWFRRLRRAYKNRTMKANLPVIRGDFEIDRNRVGRPQMPANYPR